MTVLLIDARSPNLLLIEERLKMDEESRNILET